MAALRALSSVVPSLTSHLHGKGEQLERFTIKFLSQKSSFHSMPRDRVVATTLPFRANPVQHSGVMGPISESWKLVCQAP